MGLRFDPIGGGQFKAAIKQIVEAESQPIKQIEARKVREDTKLKLFQEFKGKFASVEKALGELSSFQKFRELKVDLGDGTSQVSVTVDKEKAQPGSYQIEVDQLAARTSVISNGFEDADDPVMGMGYVNLILGNGDTSEIFIDDDESSLNGIAKAINREPNTPIRASVIKDASDKEEPWKLILSSKKDGEENSVTFPEFYFLDGTRDFYIDDTHDARNAQIQVDGFQVEMGSNDIPDFLPGINLHLKQAKPDQPFTMMITEDFQKIAGKMKGLVDEVNHILEFIVKQNAIDDKTDTRSTFAGDSGLQNIEYRLRNLLHEGYPAGDPEKGNFHLIFLNQLGVEFEKTGSLSFKEDKFQKSLEKDYEGLSQAISGESGFATQLHNALSDFSRPGNGMIASREAGMRARIKEMDKQIETKQAQVERKQQALTEQFSRLEASLSAMQRQSQYLSATLPGASGGGGNLVSQLLG